MTIIETLAMAWQALSSHKLRSLLTTLGIVIGVGSVIGMQAIGNGFRQYLAAEFDRMGAGVLYIAPAFSSEDATYPTEPRLSAADAQALAQLPGIAQIGYEYQTNGTVWATSERFSYTINGVTPNLLRITNQRLAAGRLLSEEDHTSYARVALIGSTVAQDLYGGNQAALGQRIIIEGIGFDVVGVISTSPSQASSNASDPRREIYLPYNTAQQRLLRNQLTSRLDLGRITLKISDPTQTAAIINKISTTLRERHRLFDPITQPSGFQITSLDQQARQAQQSIAGFSTFLVLIGGIALVVGGIGIMNIMLVSVSQRTREIGLRKAVGARRSDILMQFLIESILLSMAGGVLGIIVGYMLSFAGTFVMRSVFLASGTEAVVTWDSILLATGVTAAIGIIFGIVPARQAAQLQPIQALRSA